MDNIKTLLNLLSQKEKLSYLMLVRKYSDYDFNYICSTGNHTIFSFVLMQRKPEYSFEEIFTALLKKLIFISYEWFEAEEKDEPVDTGYIRCLDELYHERYINITGIEHRDIIEKLSATLNECGNLSANDKQLLYDACEKAEQAYSLFDFDLYYQGEVYLILGKDSCIMFSVEMCYDRIAMVQTIKGR